MSVADLVSRKDLFQFNAIIIAGALILLTVTIAETPSGEKAFRVFAVTALIPFLISCILLIFHGERTARSVRPYVVPLFVAKIATAIGIIYLALALGVLISFG